MDEAAGSIPARSTTESDMNKNTHIVLVLALVLVSGASYVALEHRNQSAAGIGTALAATLDTIPTQAGKTAFLKQSANLTKEVDSELIDLDSQIITCNPDVDALLGSHPVAGGSCVAGPTELKSTDGLTLGGQCCSALMDTEEYHANLEKLQAYKNMPDIPLDPMHTPIAMAKKWIEYDKTTTLTPAEQAIYDQAYAISKEKPCCCKCWHYFVNEGIAKKMIKDGAWSPEHIAGYWDASDICGS